MIVDQLKNAATYYPLNPRLERALRYLEFMDLEKLAPGRYEISGDQVFALVQEYHTKPMDQGFWEAHQKYIDVQYVVTGIERMGYACVDRMRLIEYNEEKDFARLEGEGVFLKVPAGTFLIMAPQDAHMPGMALDQPAPVKKVVVKVRV